METSKVEDPVSEIIVRCVDESENAPTAARVQRLVNPLLRYPQASAYTWQRLNEQL